MIKDIRQETKNKYQSFGIKGLTKRFRMACLSGRIETIHYMLTSADLKQNVDIHTGDDFAFRMACKRGYLELAQYLLESPELKEHADLHVYKDIAFRQASANGHLEIVEYLEKFKTNKEIAIDETNKLFMRLKLN